jgi:hypothetical protein
MNNLPLYISILFAGTTLLSIVLFYLAAHRSRTILLVLLSWITVQGIIGLSGFYTITSGIPPRFALLILPPLLCIVLLFISPSGRRFIDGLNLKTLTILHIVRIPVEIILYLLYLHQAVPQLMTFAGGNWDILSGVSAMIVYFACFTPVMKRKYFLLGWNIACLILLINIVSHAVLSAPFSFQQMAFGQPNIAILYFPFIWLPCCVVPIVLLSHVAAIRQLLKQS